MQFVVMDLERNNAYGKKIKGYFNEIIEIGAVKLNENLEITDEFSSLIKAQVTKKLRTNTKAITHITNDDIRSGVPFSKAISNFKKWIGTDDAVVTTWGDGDVRVLIDNCKYFGCGSVVPFLSYYMDLQKYFQRIMNTSKSQQIGLSSAAELLGIENDDLSLHRALDDSLLSAECFKRIYETDVIKEYIRECNEEFYARLRFKSKVISSIKNPLIDRSYLTYKCEICGTPAKQMTPWKYSNQYFRSQYYCRNCDRQVQVNVRFKRFFDRTEVRKIVNPIEIENEPDNVSVDKLAIDMKK